MYGHDCEYGNFDDKMTLMMTIAKDDDNLSMALARQTSCRWPELKLLPPSLSSVASSMSSPHIVILVNNCVITRKQASNTNSLRDNTNSNTDSLEDNVQFFLLYPLPGVKVEAERARKDHGVLPIKCLSDGRYLSATN